MTDNHAHICVPVCAKTCAELEQLSERAANAADLIEIRLDCLLEEELVDAQERILELVRRTPVPVILTLRPGEQGGHRQLSIEQRRQYWQGTKLPANAFFDIEKDLCVAGQVSDWSQVICSHHDFAGVPENIELLYDQMAETPARILKIAIFANDTVDCLPVFRLLRRASDEGRELIALAMGDAGVCTRVLGPSHGSFLTYGSSEEGTNTAPGQLTVERMKSVYRIQKLNRRTAVYGLIGSPVMHSVSPNIHNVAFESADINAVYLPFEVKNLKSFIQQMAHPDSRELDWRLMGISITAPHKLDVMQYLDWIEPVAQEVGAVNTVVVDGNKLLGYNTDADGFIRPLLKAIDLDATTRVAVIGAGGAANAALWSLKQKGVEVVLFARDVEKARLLAERFDVACEPIGVSFEGFNVVINATPLGSFGPRVNQTAATSSQLRGVKLVYDLVYNPIETRFMREANSAGCQTLGGLEMLVAQATLQFKLWTGREAPESVMDAAARRSLSDG